MMMKEASYSLYDVELITTNYHYIHIIICIYKYNKVGDGYKLQTVLHGIVLSIVSFNLISYFI